MERLRRLNFIVGATHLLQAIAILALSNDFVIPVEGKIQTGPPGSALTVDKVFFEMRFPILIAAFLLLAAVDHLLMAAPGTVKWYEANLRKGINKARWIEYSISASLMVVLIAMLTGITNLYAIIGLFAVNAAMILFGWLMESMNAPSEPVKWTPFVFGCVVGAVPWITIAVAFANSQGEGDGVPGFVYGIFFSLFLLFGCFALIQFLQYRRKGKFADYLYGERAYLIVSLVAKSALAWQVFAGTLAS